MDRVEKPLVAVTWKAVGLLGITMALLLTIAGQASAGWTKAFDVAPDIGFGTNVKAAVDGDGNASILWASQQNFGLSPYQIHVAQVPAGGFPETGPTTVLTPDGVQGIRDPDIAASEAGQVVAAFAQGPDLNNRAMAAVIPPGGDPGEPIQLTSTVDSSVTLPKVSVSPSGVALVVFSYLGAPGGEPVVSGVLISEEGVAGDPFEISSAGAGTGAVSPAVDVDDSGNFKVVWQETLTADPAVSSVHFANVSSDGDVSGSIELSTGDIAAIGPRVSAEADGDTAVTFVADGGAGVFLTRISAAGIAAEPLLVTPPGLAGDGRVNVADNGDVTVVFFGIVGGIGPRVIRVPAGGEPSAPVFIPPEGAQSFFMDVDGNASGEVLVVFSSQTDDGIEPRARMIPPTGEIPGSVALAPPGSGQPFAAGVGSGGDLIASFGNQGSELSAARLSPVLATGPTAPQFGDVKVGESANKQVVLTNEGGSPLELGAITIAGDGASDYMAEAGTCPDLTLQQGSSCVISVQFKPSAAGARPAELTVESDAIRSVSPIPLTGTGTSAPVPPEGKAAVTIRKVAPKRTNLRRGKTKSIKVTVANGGSAVATNVRVCPKLNARARKKIRARGCAPLGQIEAGSSKTALLKITAKKGKRVKGKANFAVRLTSGNGGSGSAAAVINVRK